MEAAKKIKTNEKLRKNLRYLIKYLFVPLGLAVISTLALIIAEGETAFLSGFRFAVIAFSGGIRLLGWLLLIPMTGFIMLAARSEYPVIHKALWALLLPAGALHMLLEYPDICAAVCDEYTLLPIFIFRDPLVLLCLLPSFYVLLLPYMIIDDIGRYVYIKHNWKAPHFAYTAAAWACSVFIFLGAVFLGGFAVARQQDITEQAYRDADVRLDIARSELYGQTAGRMLEKYQQDIITVAEYSREHRYYDWYNCPDESVKGVWERLFESGEASCQLSVNDSSDCITINARGIKFRVYPDENRIVCGFPDGNSTVVSYDGKEEMSA